MENELLQRQTYKGPLPKMVADATAVEKLTSRLVEVPSFVDKERGVDERGVNTYIVDFLQTYVPDISIKLQELSDGSERFNIIATRGENPKLLLLGHTDTVFPSTGGQNDPFSGEIVDGKLYGLGSTDMKGGVACALSAMAMADKNIPLAAVFYADEEFDFEGMRTLIKEGLPNSNPQLLLSLDGGDMELGTACRGIMQLRGTIRGTSAHAGRPQEGIDAISGTENMIAALREKLTAYTNNILGSPTVNRASLQGGKEFDGRIIEQGNAVPDIAQFVLDIRTSSPDIDPALVTQVITEFCQKNSLRFDPEKDITTDFAYGAWITDKNDSQVQQIAQILQEVTGEEAKFSDPKTKGYIDMQMLWDTLGKPSAVMIGPGIGTMAHKPDEYVEVKKLEQCRDVVLETIEYYGRRTQPA